MTKKLNEYGILITILSLLMIVVYSPGKYDAWDFILSLAASRFAYLYIRSDEEKDTLGSAIGCFILSAGLSSVFASVLSIFGFSKIQIIIEEKAFLNITWVFIASIIIAGGFYFFAVENKR